MSCATADSSCSGPQPQSPRAPAPNWSTAEQAGRYLTDVRTPDLGDFGATQVSFPPRNLTDATFFGGDPDAAGVL
jgi:hypothetical protein